jgi:hypothetical protein
MTCRICGRRPVGRLETPWVTVRGAGYYRCPDCGYVCLDRARLPTPAQHAARYRLHNNDPADPDYRRFLSEFITGGVAPFALGGARVLDYGSGPAPALALLLRAQGYDVACYDPYFAPDRGPLRGLFDLVWVHVGAEHLERPYTPFRRLALRLSPGGVLAIRTRFPPEAPADFARWWYREDPTHIGFFAPRTMEVLARRLGAEPALIRAPDLAVLRLRVSGVPRRSPASVYS